MMEVCEVQDVVDPIVGGVQLPQVDQEVQTVQLWDPTGTHWQHSQGPNLLSKHSAKGFVLQKVFMFTFQVHLFIEFKSSW